MDLVVALNGRTVTIPLIAGWTGQVQVNVIAGQLARKGHKASEHRVVCGQCGSGDVVELALLTGVPEAS